MSSRGGALADVLRAYRINALHDAHHEDPTFGYRYLADEARRVGWRMSRRTAWKLCSQAGILSSAQRRRRGELSQCEGGGSQWVRTQDALNNSDRRAASV